MVSSSDSDVHTNCLTIYSILKDISSIPACNNQIHQNLSLSNLIYYQDEICNSIYNHEVKGKSYGKPMLWIGIYIAAASLLCVLAMAADLFHGFRHKKLWFPSKYFTLNVASIMVITVAMKLPVDLNDPMPGAADQFAKLVSLPFMSTMIANLMPSLASMDDKELSENVIGLLILVVTIVVNVAIQIQTRVLHPINFYTYIDIGQVLYFMILLISLALTARSSKHILEIKYQAASKRASKDIDPPRTRMSTVDELIQCVRRYYIMAGTCSPQFVMATTPLCSAAGIICTLNTILLLWSYVITIVEGYWRLFFLDYYSDYGWSMFVISLTQSVGIVVGTIAPLFRCFAPLSFKLSLKWCKKHTKIFKVEKYQIKTLSQWKDMDLVFPFGGHTLKALVHHLNHFIVCVCIGIQMVIVVSCKTLALIPIGLVVIGVYCVHCWILIKAMCSANPMVPNNDVVQKQEPSDVDEDIQNYVLQLDNEMELGRRTLRRISKSVDPLIHKAEKQTPKYLLEIIERFTGFEGVLSFDSDDVQSLLSVELPNSWSLAVVTLTSLAVTLPNICKDIVDGFFNSVCEGLRYTFIVEEILNTVGEAKNIQKATRILWHKIEFEHTWLGYTLQRNDFIDKSPTEILKWFSDKAEEMIVEINKNNNEEMLDEMLEIDQDKLVAANSMYRITQTMMIKCQGNVHISEEQLFALIYDMIVSIMVACLTNLPRVIAIKCYGSTIEEREASVQIAAKLLGNTKKIIERLQACELPSMEPHKMALIDEWRIYLKHSIP